MGGEGGTPDFPIYHWAQWDWLNLLTSMIRLLLQAFCFWVVFIYQAVAVVLLVDSRAINHRGVGKCTRISAYVAVKAARLWRYAAEQPQFFITQYRPQWVYIRVLFSGGGGGEASPPNTFSSPPKLCYVIIILVLIHSSCQSSCLREDHT